MVLVYADDSGGKLRIESGDNCIHLSVTEKWIQTVILEDHAVRNWLGF